MSKLRTMWRRLVTTSERIKDHVDANKDNWRDSASDHIDKAKKASGHFLRAGVDHAKEQAKSLYVHTRYSKAKLKELENSLENQGAAYRELLRNRRITDTIFVGGESLAVLLAGGDVSQEIEAAYSAAYPELADQVGFLERARSLGDEQLSGFVSGVKGKLFEQRYAEYLNGGVFPDGYTAELASSAGQPGWDIAVYGPNQEVAQLLQAKATDSVSYVQEALALYPSIDVVTTEEVYGHLMMAGIGENIAAGGIANEDLTEYVESAVQASSIDPGFMPPEFTLAFIAFTSYRDESLTLYQKAKSAGDRTAKAYLSYIIGGSLAAITNTWWLGVLGSVSSRYLSDEAMKKAKLIEALEAAKETNQLIIDRIRGRATAA